MFHHYEDIISRIAEPPRWYDEQGVPRYCDFAPNVIGNIYANECVLLEIECSGCDQIIIAALDESRNQDSYFERGSSARFVRGSMKWQRDRSLEIPMKRPDC
jgi:hypothetical protein